MLFWGSEPLRELFVTAVSAAPEDAAPLEAVTAALDAAAVLFEPRREIVARRQPIIAANPGLQERERISSRRWPRAWRRRCTAAGWATRPRSSPEVGVSGFRAACERWVDPVNRRSLKQLTDEALGELRAVAGD